MFTNFLITALISIGLIFLLDSLSNENKIRAFFNNSIVFFSTPFIIMVIVTFTPIPYVYSDGTKMGTLTKITKKGLIFKTYEGQLNLGGMVSNGDSGMTANVFNFSIADKSIYDALVSSENKRVSLKYEQHIKVPIHMGSTQYLITEIKQ